MKLNLLPQSVSKSAGLRTAWVMSILLALAGIGGAAYMFMQSGDALKKAQDRVATAEPGAAAAVTESKKADIIMQKAAVVILNTNLATEMMKHNAVYADLFNEVKRYIPAWFRLQSISATPASPEACTVTLQGVIQTQQQYADLMLALLRIPGATSVARSGYQVNDMFVPPVSEPTQFPRLTKLGETPLPDLPMDRLNAMIASGRLDGFTGQGGFGTPDMSQARGPMPEWSQITVSVVLPRKIMTPDPRGTLATVAGLAGGAAPAPGGAAPTPAPAAPPANNRPAGGRGNEAEGDEGR